MGAPVSSEAADPRRRERNLRGALFPRFAIWANLPTPFAGGPRGHRIRRRPQDRTSQMKLTIERAALLKALGHVQSVVERRNTIPILSNVLLSAERDGVAFSATDLDMEIIDDAAGRRWRRPARSPRRPTPSTRSSRKLPEGADVELRYTGDDPRLQVSAGRSRFNLPVLPAGDFPVMSSDGLSGRDHGGHRRPDPADRQDPLRHLHRGDALLSERPLPAHRGRGRRRPSCAPWPPTATAWPWPRCRRRRARRALPGVIIPRKTIQEVRRLLEDAGETVELQLSAAEGALRLRPRRP